MYRLATGQIVKHKIKAKKIVPLACQNFDAWFEALGEYDKYKQYKLLPIVIFCFLGANMLQTTHKKMILTHGSNNLHQQPIL